MRWMFGNTISNLSDLIGHLRPEVGPGRYPGYVEK